MDEIIVIDKKKRVKIPVRKVGFLGGFAGLMFSRGGENLLFENFNGAIHSWFVFFPFLGLWLDDKNRVVYKQIVNSFTSHVKPNVKFSKLVEVPLVGEKGLNISKALEI